MISPEPHFRATVTPLPYRYNPHIPNIDVISSALITLSFGKLILNSQCEEGARDGIDIWYMRIISGNVTYDNVTLKLQNG